MKQPEEGKPDDPSRQMNEMWKEKVTDDLAEAVELSDLIDTLLEQVKKGTIRLDMSLEDAVDALATRTFELTGEDEEGESGSQNLQ